MKKSYLLDTHIILWILTQNNRLDISIKRLVEDIDIPVFFSQISLYEIAIKQKIGKLPEVPQSIGEIHTQLIADGYNFLPIHNPHIEAYNHIDLQDTHRDPFDRLFLATAYQEKMTFITADSKFSLYEHQVAILFCK
jgi:PIN domain nuclease of toxin-antitoxin system